MAHRFRVDLKTEIEPKNEDYIDVFLRYSVFTTSDDEDQALEYAKNNPPIGVEERSVEVIDIVQLD